MTKSDQRTDDDITDEATGRARVEWAAESEWRRQEEMRLLARSNAEMRRRIHNAPTRVGRPCGNPTQQMHSQGSPLPPGEGSKLWEEAYAASLAADQARRQLATMKYEAERTLTADQAKMRTNLKKLSKRTAAPGGSPGGCSPQPSGSSTAITTLATTSATSPSEYTRHTGLFQAALYRLTGTE